MPPREPKRRRPTPLTIGLGIGAAGCFALAIGLWTSSVLAQRQMAELSPIDGLVEDADLVTEDHDGLPLTDEEAQELTSDPWEGAEESFPGLAAWLEIDGVGISTPVMQATEDEPDWYLHHDAFGSESSTGLPYLDHRCTEGSLLRVVYAHNLGWGSSEGFSSLADCWQQDLFGELGTLHWADLRSATQPDASGSTGDGTTNRGDVIDLHPICALKIDGAESDLLDYDLDQSGAPAWLDSVRARASAVAGETGSDGVESSRYIALVTCSGDGYPSRSRTLVLFGDGAGASVEPGDAPREGVESMAQAVGGTEGED